MTYIVNYTTEGGETTARLSLMCDPAKYFGFMNGRTLLCSDKEDVCYYTIIQISHVPYQLDISIYGVGKVYILGFWHMQVVDVIVRR